MSDRHVFSFARNDAEGDSKQRDLLGGKGANLAEMCRLGLPVPPGFTIATTVCREFYDAGNRIPDGVWAEVGDHIGRLEEQMGQRFGGKEKPLLVSVRSGAAASMPGMMDTVLNLGLNDDTLEALARSTGNRRFALDAHRRLLNMFGDVVMGVGHERFDGALTQVKSERGVRLDTELDEDGMAANSSGLISNKPSGDRLWPAARNALRRWA